MALTTVSQNPVSLNTALRQVEPYQQPSGTDNQPVRQNTLPVPVETGKTYDSQGTKLVAETQQALEDGGYRRTRTFEREDGRQFTRVEDFSLTDRGSRRTVTQQNPSGTITQYEEVLDRDGSGNFRRTQRFRDEAGETSVQITPDYKVTDPFILTSGSVPSDPVYATPFASFRGTQLDLSA